MPEKLEFMKESYEVIEAKLALAELTIKLGAVTREKWKRLEDMKPVMQEEEDLIKLIAEKTEVLRIKKEEYKG